MLKPKQVLSVGQCDMDHGNLQRALDEAFRVEVIPAASAAEATALARTMAPALIMVNRVFDVDGGSGLEFIRTVKADSQLAGIPVMLLSNFENYQAEAVAAGAVPGFGKAVIGQPAMLAALAPILVGQG